MISGSKVKLAMPMIRLRIFRRVFQAYTSSLVAPPKPCTLLLTSVVTSSCLSAGTPV